MTTQCVWGVLTVWRVITLNLTQLQATFLKAFGVSVSSVLGFSHMRAYVHAQQSKDRCLLIISRT